MNMQYDTELKRKLCTEICLNGNSTIKLAKEYNVPIKTLEKWITAFNKDNHCFDPKIEIVNDFKLVDNNFKSINYDDFSIDDLKKELMKKDIQIARLKKNYTVKGSGIENKVFITFSTKNMK